MIGTPSAANPRAFVNARLDEAVGAVVAVIREIRPHVVITYDPNGGYVTGGGWLDAAKCDRSRSRGEKLPPITKRQKTGGVAVRRSHLRLNEKLRAGGHERGEAGDREELQEVSFHLMS